MTKIMNIIPMIIGWNVTNVIYGAHENFTISESSWKGFICDTNNNRIHTIRYYPTCCRSNPGHQGSIYLEKFDFLLKIHLCWLQELKHYKLSKLSIINTIHSSNYFYSGTSSRLTPWGTVLRTWQLNRGMSLNFFPFLLLGQNEIAACAHAHWTMPKDGVNRREAQTNRGSTSVSYYYFLRVLMRNAENRFTSSRDIGEWQH